MKKFLLIVLLFISFACFAESRNALLIANGKYTSFSGLKNPVPEARELGKALEKIGFEVTVIENATREEMYVGLSRFQKKLKADGGIAFFHYGGHAVQVGGRNYLIPVDADIPNEELVEYRAVNVDEVMTNMKGESNIVVLDACRNNPLPAGSGRSATRGLQLCSNRPQRSIVVYSAEPGNVAQDGVFTPILTKKITQAKSFNDILSEVSMEVYEATGGKQSPGSYTQLFPTTYLAGIKTQPQQQRSERTTVSDNDIEKSLDSVINTSRNYTQSITKSTSQSAANKGRSNSEAQKLAKEISKQNFEVSRDGSGNIIIGENRFFCTAEVKLISKAVKVVGKNSDGAFVKGRTVTLSPYYIGKYEVTQQLFEFVMNYNPSKCNSKDANYPLSVLDYNNLRPVDSVNWYQAITFCNKLSLIMGYKPCYKVAGITDWEELTFKDIPTGANTAWDNVVCDFDAQGYRLPTEAEWEYAANIGSTKKFAGSNSINAYAWYVDNSRSAGTVGSHQVGKKLPNKKQLFDMTGNVCEWCWDWFGAVNREIIADPIGPERGSARMAKGGSWDETVNKCFTSYRSYYGPHYSGAVCGFRMVRSTQ